MDKIAFYTNKYIHLLTDSKCEWVKDISFNDFVKVMTEIRNNLQTACAMAYLADNCPAVDFAKKHGICDNRVDAGCNLVDFDLGMCTFTYCDGKITESIDAYLTDGKVIVLLASEVKDYLC